ncbi:MAG: AraC family transcriptional regulator [Verrucomicrobiota bacterium]
MAEAVSVTSFAEKTSRSGSEPKRMAGFSLYRISRGRTRWVLDRDSVLLREGDFFWVRPGQVFGGIESSEEVSLEVEGIRLAGSEFEATSLELLLERAAGLSEVEAHRLGKVLEETNPPRVRMDQWKSELFVSLVRENWSDSVEDQDSLRAGVFFVLTLLARAIRNRSSPNSLGLTETEGEVAEFLAELEAHCAETWTLESLAEGAGLKRSRFGTLCRKLTGESPMTYLNRLRIRRSRRLLRDSDLSITEIAFDCGFASSQYFAKQFRRLQGHEPTHYRRIARETIARSGVQYLKGESARTVALAKGEIVDGDFSIEGTLILDRLGGTAASLEFGPDRFGFDGREGRFFLEGATFGDAQFFERSSDLIAEGTPFSVALQRSGENLSAEIEGQTIFRIRDAPERWVGRVGLRPLRNGIRVLSFAINGVSSPLRDSLV